MLRKPAVAGTFYAGEKDSLKKQIEDCFLHPLGPGKIPAFTGKAPGKILGLISPHAGYVYSGPIAAWGFSSVIEREKSETVVILGPNHRGFGAPVAVMSQGEWETPLGRLSIDQEFAEKLLDIVPTIVEDDEKAHQREHSLEVQLPFLQYAWGNNFKIVPICLTDQTTTTSINLGKAISELIKERENVLLIASTDFTHYQPQKIAEKEDRKLIDAIISGDPRNLGKLLSSYVFSMCGYGGVMTVMEVARLLGAGKIQLLKYATSGDITGDYSAVVGYASLIIEKE